MWVVLLGGFLAGLAAAPISALQIGASFSTGNLVFAPGRSPTDTSFDGTAFPWGISASAIQPISDQASIDAALDYDPVLRYTISALFTYREQFFTVGVGPSFGIFNSTAEPLKSGIAATFALEWPGVAFVNYFSDNTLGGALVEPGDYIQERNDLSVGFYVPNAICSLNLLTRRYVSATTTGSTIDDLSEYSFKTNLFQKNVPYRVLLTFGYQSLSESFVTSGSTTVDTLGSLIVGTRIEASIGGSFTYVFDLTSSVYTFGQGALVGLSNPGPPWLDGYLFRLTTGIQVNLDQLLNHGVSTK